MKQGYWWIIGIILAGASALSQACSTTMQVYYWADQRNAEHEVFSKALNCDEATPESLENAIISLGRIGGEVAVEKITPLLSHSSTKVRKAAAFALGIAKVPTAGDSLIVALESEKTPEVQYRLALGIGNTGHKDARQVLTEIINQDDSSQKVRGAMQGLVLLSAFHRDSLDDLGNIDPARILAFLANQDTQLEASYLLARVAVLDANDVDSFLELMPELAPTAQANVLRALAKTQQRQLLPSLLTALGSQHISVRVNAIRGLANYAENPVAVAGILQALASEDIISQVTALQIMQAEWLKNAELLKTVKTKLKRRNSWIQSEALLALIRAGKGGGTTAKQWLQSDAPNHQRAAIAYFVEQKDYQTLGKLAKSDKKIIANGAKQALAPTPDKAEKPSNTPETIPSSLRLVTLKTTKGDITIKPFADTPYTSANFIRLIEEGFYDNSYFHRVIPNFVAQGGSNIGDGSGTVGYSIREELSYRSHLPGTVGMATLGKDTGGAQFFINIAPNLHLDSNYTIFGEVIEGMGVAMQLEQNDKVIAAEVAND